MRDRLRARLALVAAVVAAAAAVSRDTFVVEVPAGRPVARPGVVWAAEDARYRAAREPDDPCWGSCPILLGGQRHLRTVGAPRAWDVTTGSADVLVAVVDTRVDGSHPELRGKVVQGPDLRTDQGCKVGDAVLSSHGTAVAGIIAGQTDNGAGMASLGWATRVLAVPVLDDCGWGSASGVAAGIRAAIAAGARVVNLSLAGPAHPQNSALP